MKQILMAFMFVVATVAPANAITLWYDHETNTKVIEIQPGESANEELHCMAQNIYWEARNQSRVGMIAVGRVVINRMQDTRFPNDICAVIKEGPVRESWKTRQTPDPDDAVYYPKRDRCQFSWYCDGKKDDIPMADIDYAWRTAQDIAFEIIYNDRWRGVVEGATHYHANYVKPKWRHSLHYVGRVDDHLFYRWD